MNEEQHIRAILLNKFGLRVQPEMGRYLLKQLAAANSGDSIPVIGGDARTGVAIRQLVAADQLRAAMQSANS